MPPKGWRKNAEGQYPQPNKDQELVSIDEILFPRTTVQKLAKHILNSDEESENTSNMLMAKDSVTALQRSATVFVSHLLFQARQLSKESGRKTVNAQDILGALEKAEFSGFIPEVKQRLSVYETNISSKKKQKLETKAASLISSSNAGNISDNPSNKRQKDNKHQVIQKNGETTEEVAVDEEDEDATDDVIVDDTNTNDLSAITAEVEDEEEEEEEEEEEGDTNPIAVLDQEEEELRGTEEDEEDEIEDNSDDDD